MKKDVDWLKNEVNELPIRFIGFSMLKQREEFTVSKDDVLELINQLDEPEVLSQEWIKHNQLVLRGVNGSEHYVPSRNLYGKLVPKQEEVDRAYREGFKEGERQTVEYFESITEEPSKEQVWKYLSEHGIEVVDKEPETVVDVVTTFWKSYERLKEVMNMEVEEMEE